MSKLTLAFRLGQTLRAFALAWTKLSNNNISDKGSSGIISYPIVKSYYVNRNTLGNTLGIQDIQEDQCKN